MYIIASRKNLFSHILKFTYLCNIQYNYSTLINKTQFKDLNLSSNMLKCIKNIGLIYPNPIQSLAIPELLSSTTTDIIIASQTGTGKTYTYLLPLIDKIKSNEKNIEKNIKNNPSAIIMVPSRELALQTLQVAKLITHYMKLKVRMIIGGKQYDSTTILKDGSYDILIITAGKLLQLLHQNSLKTLNLKYVIMDEADLFFHPSKQYDFLETTLNILSYFNGKQHIQHILIGASFSNFILKIIKHQFSAKIKMISTTTLHQSVDKLQQQFIYLTKEDDKITSLKRVLLDLLGLKEGLKIMIFCQSIASCRAVSHSLQEDLKIANMIKIYDYHSKIPAEQRQVNFKQFQTSTSHLKYDILITTDLASRGLDTRDISYIIQFDFTTDILTYLHRIGRTARNNQIGTNINLITVKDYKHAKKLENLIENQKSLFFFQKKKKKIKKNFFFFKKKKKKKKKKKNFMTDLYGNPINIPFYQPKARVETSTMKSNVYQAYKNRQLAYKDGITSNEYKKILKKKNLKNK